MSHIAQASSPVCALCGKAFSRPSRSPRLICERCIAQQSALAFAEVAGPLSRLELLQRLRRQQHHELARTLSGGFFRRLIATIQCRSRN